MVKKPSSLPFPSDAAPRADIDSIPDLPLRVFLTFGNLDVAHAVIPLKDGRANGYAPIAIHAFSQVENRTSRHIRTTSDASHTNLHS
jgi:hypothetical protein